MAQHFHLNHPIFSSYSMDATLQPRHTKFDYNDSYIT